MAVRTFTDGLEPEDLDAPVWRFICLERFKDLVESKELFFNRADRFPQDDQEGLPPEEYIPILRLNRYDLNDAPLQRAAVNDRWHEPSVECYAGYRGEETPIRFRCGDRVIEIDEVLVRWFAPDHRHFKVRTADRGGLYPPARHDSGEWELV
jgi:hypothetical protein